MFKKLENKMEYSFIKMLLARIKSKSPKFYIDMRYISISIGLLAGFLVGVVKLQYLPIPDVAQEQIISICKEICTFMGGVWGVSFTGTTNTDLITNNQNKES